MLHYVSRRDRVSTFASEFFLVDVPREKNKPPPRLVVSSTIGSAR
jgi:hypothetical protein